MSLESDLSSFYDQQAPARAQWSLSEERIEARTAFAAGLRTGRRSAVVDIGAGAGQDAEAFLQAGLSVTTVDLSTRHLDLCLQKGAQAAAGSVLSLPFRNEAFHAAWSMSTLLHVPDHLFARALSEIRRCLVPEGVLGLGLWGGKDEEQVFEDDHFEPHRFFAYRSDQRLKKMLAEHGPVSNWTTWDSPADDTHYQFCHLHFA